MTQDEREALAAKVHYCGSPYHKRNPADYGMPESKPRPDKTLCDAERPLGLEEAEALLRAGIGKGLLNEQFRGVWPQNIWSVDAAGMVYEAQLQNSESGAYHDIPCSWILGSQSIYAVNGKCGNDEYGLQGPLVP